MKSNIIIISKKGWPQKFIDEIKIRSGSEVFCLEDKSQVNFENIKALNPAWVFFPHWSYIIPAEVYENFQCVVFHMTDLPFGRGGTPLQNLIQRGIYETKLTAFKCVKELDAGDIYLKKNLSLFGSAEEIYLRAAFLVKEMIIEMVKTSPTPTKQVGEVTEFKRRKPEDGAINDLNSLEKIFDYIRMLDAETYPPAFLDTKNLHLEFTRASLRNGYIQADVKIFLKEEN